MKTKYFIIFISLFSFSLFFLGCEATDKSLGDLLENKTTPASTTYSNCSYFTGEECSDEEKTQIPFMIMIENSSASRPQSGLSQADIIYETSAEGGIPRFIALFQKNSPNTIGPVRSVRPYYLNIAKEYDLPVAHCGGSEDALNEISSNNKLKSINEIPNGTYFWRDSSKSAPHNLYTSSQNIRNYITDKSITAKSTPLFSFDANYFNKDNLTPCVSVKITINKSYNTSYSYEDGLYAKSMDGTKSIDSLNNSPLTFSNVIIQKTDITINPDNVHLDIKQVGKGDGYLFSKGKIIDILWEKPDENSKTKLTDKKGNEISLSPGKTIYHIIDKKTDVEFK